MSIIKSGLARNLAFAFVLIVVSLAVREVIEPYKHGKQPHENVAHGVFHETINSESLRLEGPYNFTDQSGSAFEISRWFDKPLIISYIFTKCEHVCPALSASISRFVKSSHLKLGEDYRIVSVGFDTANDTQEALERFGGEYTDSFESWRFVTGSVEEIKRLSKKIGVFYKLGEDGEWSHTMGVTIVAPGGVVFSMARGLDYSADTLSEPIMASVKNKKD